jgi:glycosyltransferase involved in cell wall biosynthesis
MAKRRKIGIIYQYNENWIGGTYYIQNLIAALKRLPQNDLFELVVFTEDNNQFLALKKVTDYPFLTRGSHVIKLPLIQRIINRIYRLIFHKNIFSVFIKNLDLLFPAYDERFFKKDQQFLYWIPDFQEHYLPEFFNEEEIARRKNSQEAIIKKGRFIVFSSQSAKRDFNEIYPANSLTQFVLNFAVTHPLMKDCNSIKEKYKTPERYFICCNQFYKHKNHGIVFKAIEVLKSQGHKICVLFTGKENDDRHPDFFNEITQVVSDLGIGECIQLLGFINREDQLCLMKNALAVIQPSLFEGWSTVIEDAKAIQAKVIASNISVHQEQLEAYGLSALFAVADEYELAKLMLGVDNMIAITPNYDKNITAFAKKFKMIADTISIS